MRPSGRQLAVACACLLLAGQTAECVFWKRGPKQLSTEQLQQEHFRVELRLMARLAVTADERVMLTTGDEFSVVSHLPLMLTSMQMVDGGDMADHLVVVTSSGRAFHSCVKLHKFCLLDTFWAFQHHNHSRLTFGDSNFTALLWRKHEIVRELVHSNFDVLSLDMDVVAFRNLLSDHVLDYKNQSLDLMVQKEHLDPAVLIVNIGVYFLRSTSASQIFLDQWLHSKRRALWDQWVVNDLLWNSTNSIDLRDLQWEHIPVATGVGLCHMGLPLDAQMANLTQNFADWLVRYPDLAFFHTACWAFSNQFSKADALQNVLSVYLLSKNHTAQRLL